MTDFDTPKRPDPAPGLPMLLAPSAPRPFLGRSQTTAAFVSQLLAARNNLAPQRRRGTVAGALGAYNAGAGATRMPAGYRRTVVA
ncbi:hypothetical protein [uncultured Devosia sp.]|uniref:hypothetical protein n=1 Tax=uncultured Devosia sp. TaxID=211434 RepID=UPI0035CB1AED